MHLTFRNIDEALPELFREVMTKGAEVPSRNGLTKELTHIHIELTHPRERQISVDGRNHNPAAQIAETMWVLAGRNDVEFLAHYLPRSPQFSDDGKVWRAGYGARLRNFNGYGVLDDGIDQLRFVVDLLKQDPDTRRAVMSIWDPVVDTQPGKDIPCNNWLHFLPRNGKLDLHVAIRSNDLMWGWSGINQFEWSVLLEVVASLTGMQMGHLHFSISSLHLYEQHWDKAMRLARAEHGPRVMTPRLEVRDLCRLDTLIRSWFAVEEVLRVSRPKASLDVASFSDPLLKNWLDTIQSYWLDKVDPFIERVTKLHDQKHEAYGDSWMKRGELFSIIPNIARKVDRLASGRDTDDETQADTAIDLLVYLAKYRCWLTQNVGSPIPDGVPEVQKNWTKEPAAANALIGAVQPQESGQLVTRLLAEFEVLLLGVQNQAFHRYVTVDGMLPLASALAREYADA